MYFECSLLKRLCNLDGLGEKKREQMRKSVCVWDRERKREYVCVREREREYVWEGERVMESSKWENEKEREREREVI